MKYILVVLLLLFSGCADKNRIIIKFIDIQIVQEDEKKIKELR